MIDNTSILATIQDLDRLYNTNQTEASYYSKLALLELCGWIEESMDTIVCDCSDANLQVATNKKFVLGEIVDRTWGFLYPNHFRPMLMKLIGLIRLEHLENTINNNGDLDVLISQLSSLNKIRGEAAHNSMAGTTVTFEAPSKINQYLTAIYSTLRRIETELQAINNNLHP